MQTLSLQLEAATSNETVTERYTSKHFSQVEDLLNYLQAEHVDCLIVQATAELPLLFDQLQQAVLLPAVIVEFSAEAETAAFSVELSELAVAYHTAVVKLVASQINQIGLAIDQAISKFIQLKPDGQSLADTIPQLSHPLMAEQLRLAEKLRERLDYLGVYYKRNSQNFLRNMTSPQKEELLRQLKLEYREIILSYFANQPHLNEKIDNLVNVSFFADVPIAQIVEIHMDLMDEFSKQLKLEGRSDEVLLDYRLTLIDTLAHLCEMYRRSIPREA